MNNPNPILAAGRTAALAAAMIASATAAHAQSAIIYGSLGNFDISNDTGRVCHGFEIELDGLSPSDVPYSFTAQRYGAPNVLATPSGIKVRWESPYDASSGQYAERTLPHVVPWFPGQCYQWNPGTYQDSGCEHFGTGATRNPTRSLARWLCEDNNSSSGLVPVDPPTAVPSPTYYVQAPARAGNPPQVVMEVEAPEPAEAPSLYGDAQWIRVFVTELPREVNLDELMADNPAVVPMDPAQLEADWDVIQDEPVAGGTGNRKRKRHGRDLQPSTRSVIRRIEMYAYTGAYDPVTHEALCADGLCSVPADGEVGELVSTQMTAVNVVADSLTITKSGTGVGNVESADKTIACGSKCAALYNAGDAVTLTAKPASGSVFSGWTGACSGTATTCTVSVNGHVDVGAKFSPAPVSGGGGTTSGATLSVKVAGGKALVTSTPAGINCGRTCSAPVVPGTVVTLTATPEPGFRFVNWTGACTGTAATCTLTVNKSGTAQANLTK